MLLDSGFQQFSILGFHVQRFLSLLAGTFHLQLLSWTNGLPTADLQLKLSVLDWLTCPNGPWDGPNRKHHFPHFLCRFMMSLLARTPFPAVLSLVTLHGMTYSIVASLFIVSQPSNGRLFWLTYSGLQQTCHNISVQHLYERFSLFPIQQWVCPNWTQCQPPFTTLLILKWCSTSLKIWAVTESSCTSCKVTTLLTANCVLDTSPEEGVHCDKWGLHIDSSPHLPVHLSVNGMFRAQRTVSQNCSGVQSYWNTGKLKRLLYPAQKLGWSWINPVCSLRAAWTCSVACMGFQSMKFCSSNDL
jgi:hypothetical protein